MKKIIFGIIAIFAIQVVVISCKPAEDDDSEIPAEIPNTTSTAPIPPRTNPLQCLYDFKNYRVNKGCNVEMPPNCARGKLVSTKNGDDFEMCCCDFSKLVDSSSTSDE